jgi:hypothetical protein
MMRRGLAFLFGHGSWVWWHGALAVAFVLLLGVILYAWRDPKGPGAGILMFMVFCLAWLMMLIFSTVDVLRWSFARDDGWGLRIGFIVLAWIAVGLLWTLLFWATDPNYPEKLLPGRILFTAHCVALYFGNLWMLSEARA